MAPKLIVRSIDFAERPVRFKMPFRFGAVTVEGAPQVFVHVEIEVEGHGRSMGATAEMLVPKWFNKDPGLTVDQTVDQLRRSLDIARKLYLLEPRWDTAFGLSASRADAQISECSREGIPDLAAAYGPAELDKAVLDALLRALGLDVFEGLRRNVGGLDARLTTNMDGAAIEAFLSGRRPAETIAVRHTVGLVDPVASLGHEVSTTGCRYFKLKLGGEPEQDHARLATIAEALAATGVDYRVTVDANEQYADIDALKALCGALAEADDLKDLAARLLYIEQPLPREKTWDTPLRAIGERFAFIIDEADAHYNSFEQAQRLGYRGVSSKSCKGLYKALLNGARSALANRAGIPTFVAAEDLTCQAGLAVQQDTALAAFLGIAHAERNGHHYVDGFADTPQDEARRFLDAHSDLYEDAAGTVQLKIRDGALAIGSLAQPGFASGVRPGEVGPVAAKHVTRAVHATAP
jgi:hypothetical protein